jgi:hypothetical protein
MTKEEKRLYNKQWREKNKNYFQEYYVENKEQIINQHKEYTATNKEYIYSRNQKYSKTHYTNNSNMYKEYMINRYHTNIQTKLSHSLRCRLNNSLKDSKISAKKLLGCNIKEYKQHIESQLKPEMNWNNHGKVWEIDHIKPCDSFDLTDIEQQKQCFHYTNLQPLFKTTSIAESFGYNEIGNRNKSNN